MKDFLKFTFATITGIIITSVALFLIGIVTLIGVASSSDSEVVVQKNSVMMLDLSGLLQERAIENPFEKLLGDDNYSTYGLDDILASIKKAKEHENIKGIYIQANHLSTSFASLQEIRNALIDFKASGKFIVAYGDFYTQGLYYISSVADKVMLNPKGRIDWRGLASVPVFYKELLDKLGIEMQVFKVGTYKSAVEPFINTEMSDANREQVKEYIGSIWGEIVGGVAESRKIPAETLNQIADKMIMFDQPEKVVEYQMVDTLIYKNDVRNYLKQLIDIKEDDRLPILGLADMINVRKETPKDKSGNIIAIYYAAGAIDSGSSSSMEEQIVSNKVIKDLRKLKDDENVKAVVLRVNSPGGSAFGSEQIWYAVEELKAKKPVVVSMGNYAASGGYYISCGADYIVAQPTTLTGSIGIFGMVPNVEGLTKKIGINFDAVKTNKFSDFGATGRGLNNDEKALMQMMVNDGYDLFLTRCADGRNMPKEELAKIAEGRVWDGQTAQKLGLVDALGGLDKALEVAIEKADVDGYTVLAYPEKESIWNTLLKEKPGNYIENRILKSNLGDYYNQLTLLKSLEDVDLLQARLPFDLNIK